MKNQKTKKTCLSMCLKRSRTREKTREKAKERALNKIPRVMATQSRETILSLTRIPKRISTLKTWMKWTKRRKTEVWKERRCPILSR